MFPVAPNFFDVDQGDRSDQTDRSCRPDRFSPSDRALDSCTPIFRQIADQLRQAIDSKVYKPGEMPPSLRAMAIEINVNPNTVQRAYEALEREGVVETRRGVGIVVASAVLLSLGICLLAWFVAYKRLIDSDPSNTADRESLTWYTEQTKAAKTNP